MPSYSEERAGVWFCLIRSGMAARVRSPTQNAPFGRAFLRNRGRDLLAALMRYRCACNSTTFSPCAGNRGAHQQHTAMSWAYWHPAHRCASLIATIAWCTPSRAATRKTNDAAAALNHTRHGSCYTSMQRARRPEPGKRVALPLRPYKRRVVTSNPVRRCSSTHRGPAVMCPLPGSHTTPQRLGL